MPWRRHGCRPRPGPSARTPCPPASAAAADAVDVVAAATAAEAAVAARPLVRAAGGTWAAGESGGGRAWLSSTASSKPLVTNANLTMASASVANPNAVWWCRPWASLSRRRLASKFDNSEPRPPVERRAGDAYLGGVRAGPSFHVWRTRFCSTHAPEVPARPSPRGIHHEGRVPWPKLLFSWSKPWRPQRRAFSLLRWL